MRCTGSQGLSTFEEVYRDIVNPVRERIAELGATDAPIRFEKVRSALQELIDRGEDALGDSEVLDVLGASSKQARELLDRGNSFVTDMRDTGWIILTREGNGGIIMADTFVSILGKLSLSMASLFLVVGLLVCYSAMSRMVHEQVVQIGTKKALGFRRSEVSRLYLAYAGIAVILGMLLGVVGAIVVVQRILNPVIANRFVIGHYPAFFSATQTLTLGGAELLLILGTTWLSCASVLRKEAVRLLAGQEPPTAREHFFEHWNVWRRLPLLYQTILTTVSTTDAASPAPS